VRPSCFRLVDAMPDSTPSDDLQNELANLLARSRKLRCESDALEAEVQRVAGLIAEDALRSRDKMVMGSMDGGPAPLDDSRPSSVGERAQIQGAADSVDPLTGSR
jgi:hypothetical protein